MALAFLIGGILLIHAGYSSYEFHSILKSASSTVPLDIMLEAVVAILIINYGAIQSIRNKPRLGLGHDKLVEPTHAFMRPIKLSEATGSINKLGISEYEELDTRADFVDVRKKRKEFAEWVKNGKETKKTK